MNKTITRNPANALNNTASKFGSIFLLSVMAATFLTLILASCVTQPFPKPVSAFILEDGEDSPDGDPGASAMSIYRRDQENKAKGLYGEKYRISTDILQNRVDELEAIQDLVKETGGL
jgi:hypothetical protein